MYPEEVKDPIFRATGRRRPKKQSEWFLADKEFAVIGCTDQFQLCNPVSGDCTELTSNRLVKEQLLALQEQLSEQQLSTALRIVMFHVGTMIHESVFLAEDKGKKTIW